MSEIIINGTQLNSIEVFFYTMLILVPWIHGAIDLIGIAVKNLINPAFRYFVKK